MGSGTNQVPWSCLHIFSQLCIPNYRVGKDIIMYIGEVFLVGKDNLNMRKVLKLGIFKFGENVSTWGYAHTCGEVLEIRKVFSVKESWDGGQNNTDSCHSTPFKKNIQEEVIPSPL